MAENGKVTTIPGEQFFKSLGALDAMAKSGGEQTQPAGDDVNKAQLFHTPSSSETASAGWPGGKKTNIGNKWDDSIGTDGTDYKAARKAIMEKVEKGLALEPAELAILKGDIEHSISKGEGQEVEGSDSTPGPKGEARPGLPFNKSSDDDDDDKEKFNKEKMFGKSLEGMAASSETVQKGIEISPFLAEFAAAFGARMDSIDKSMGSQITEGINHMLSQIGPYLDARFDEQGDFNKSLADAVVNIGHGVAGNIEQTQQQAEAPAGPPKSQLQVLQGGQPGQTGILQKSFDGPGGEQLTKGQISDALVDMVTKGHVNALEVSKFDMTNELRPDLHEAVVKYIQAAGQQ